jgi:hypothetical protein
MEVTGIEENERENFHRKKWKIFWDDFPTGVGFSPSAMVLRFEPMNQNELLNLACAAFNKGYSHSHVKRM